jgi:hypothetical protein
MSVIKHKSKEKKVGWAKCLVCGKKHEKYLEIPGLPFFICPKCGHVFVPAGDLAVALKIAKSPTPLIIKPGEARRILH